ncbi:hypothetical protein [Dolosigranulum pigrum]|uniref:hypothetical protein n=1 Tax=Dolosigranulum pigrum TaxID=29394 RepID=UPI001AD8622D|nr:hypothetical protein [Dolosigranulum pigrum]QTJ33968.1 hypothetical protein FE322_00900 [Dolosigranulum pigrum]QTJ39144.1 hypothetical protein FE325_00870 [Dolosigranulum pigrum]QTJ47633.1 hypothetical protein FE330_00875 [Dolosigranulum pigrum]
MKEANASSLIAVGYPFLIEHNRENLEEYKNIHNQQNAGTSTYAVSDETKDFICSVVVNMSGAAIGTVYTSSRWTGSKFRSMAYK